ncbi:MAG: hypothetical protein II574_07775, partial [Ruminococcus sp.]|nr:hypothetical protein [Ruminococcus sp.]
MCYDFNFAVLTSKASYSCGNLVPCIAKQDGIICGLGVFQRVFEILDSGSKIEFYFKDGDKV